MGTKPRGTPTREKYNRRGAFHISCITDALERAARKFRLRKRSRVIDPLAVVSDGNGRASEQASNRAIEQSSNRAHDQPDNQFIHPMHGSVLHPALSRVLRTRTYITRARNMYDVLFCESQLAEARVASGGDYSVAELSSSFD